MEIRWTVLLGLPVPCVFVLNVDEEAPAQLQSYFCVVAQSYVTVRAPAPGASSEVIGFVCFVSLFGCNPPEGLTIAGCPQTGLVRGWSI